MEFGEAVAFGMAVGEAHDEGACPWHGAHSPKEGEALEAASPPERASLQENRSSTLGRNLTTNGEPAPPGFTVRVGHAADGPAPGGAGVRYRPSAEGAEYPVQYAPHHLIPGNESLQGHPLLRWMAGDGKLGPYVERAPASMLKPGQSIGYDINAAANGAWLPGPYAVVDAGGWTPKALGAPGVADFKRAFAFAAMDVAGRHFHFRHTAYSAFVSEVLSKIEQRADRESTRCPESTGGGGDDGKFLAPQGLAARLDAVSRRLRPYVTGAWNARVYTDNDAGPPYVAEMRARRLGLVPR